MQSVLLDDPEVQILTYNISSSERAWIQMAGISPDRIVEYDPELSYEADTLYMATPVTTDQSSRQEIQMVSERITLQGGPGGGGRFG